MNPRLQQILMFLLMGMPAVSQHPFSSCSNFEEFMEMISEETETGETNAAFIEELQDLHQNPVKINTAGREDLLRIPFLNEIMVNTLLEYRQKHGKFYSTFELSSVPGLDRDLAEKISWFISAGMDESLESSDTIRRKKGIHQMLFRSNITFPFPAGFRKEGEKPPAYTGHPLAVLTKYSYEQRDFLSLGCTADKDAGEEFLKGSNRYGFDFYSGFASLTLKGIIRRVTVGDFTVRTGQGLVCRQGFSMGKSSDVMQASKNMSQIKPYTSSDENRFFRGAAVSCRYRNAAAHFFFSSKKSDGNLSVDETGAKLVTSLQTSGYHRTGSENEDEKSVRHSIAGTIITLFNRQVKAGLTGLVEKFRFPLDPGDQLYEKFYFRGRYNFNVSADYHWISGRYHLFGEAAISRSGGTAFIQGIEAELHDQLKATILFRNFGKDYHATWAGAFGSGSAASSETGWYAGLRFLPAAGITVSAWADWYYFPWIKYNTASPARGQDFMVQTDLSLNRRVSGYIRYKTGCRSDKVTDGMIYGNRDVNKGNLRIHSRFDSRKRLSFAWRLELSGISDRSSGTGILCYQDMAWTPAKIPVSAILRISWFRIPAWENRIYAYENDLLYAFSTFSFFGKGFRTYFRTKIEMGEKLEIWCKMGQSWYPGQEKTGTGYSEKKGNIIRDVKFQIRYRF